MKQLTWAKTETWPQLSLALQYKALSAARVHNYFSLWEPHAGKIKLISNVQTSHEWEL